MEKTYNLKNLTIGSKIFVVHKNYVNQKKPGGKVLLARIVSFLNVSGIVISEFKLVGFPTVVNENSYTIFTDINLVIEAIKS